MSQQTHTLTPETSAWLADTFARNRARFGGWRMEESGGESSGSGEAGTTGEASKESGEPGSQGKEQTFTQADIDRIVKERVQREKAKYADYDDLKKKADGAKTAEERMAELEREIATTKHEALKRRVQAAHSISDEDADLFLTGQDEESLTAQAKRLAQRESERKKQGNRVAREGNNSTSKPNDEREFVRNLFGGGD